MSGICHTTTNWMEKTGTPRWMQTHHLVSKMGILSRRWSLSLLPGAMSWWILDVRVTAGLRDSAVGLSPFLLPSGGSDWLALVLVTGLLGHTASVWAWLLLFGEPFCELDSTPNFWLRSVKFWTWRKQYKVWKIQQRCLTTTSITGSISVDDMKMRKARICNRQWTDLPNVHFAQSPDIPVLDYM